MTISYSNRKHIPLCIVYECVYTCIRYVHCTQYSFLKTLNSDVHTHVNQTTDKQFINYNYLKFRHGGVGRVYVYLPVYLYAAAQSPIKMFAHRLIEV